jgi:hypothetical protein
MEKDNSLFRDKVSEMSKTLNSILEKKETGKPQHIEVTTSRNIELSINDETSVKEKLS